MYKRQLEACRQRVGRPAAASAYVGGVAFNGAHGLASTRLAYPPFFYLNIRSLPDEHPHLLAGSIGAGQKNTRIDLETLLAWNPDYIFLDAAGRDLWQPEFEEKPLLRTLKAYRRRQVFVVLPFNWHTINYESLLCNTWFIGRTLYPEKFGDVAMQQKGEEIISMYLRPGVYARMQAFYGAFEGLPAR